MFIFETSCDDYSCMTYLKVLLLAFQGAFQGLDVLEMGTAFLFVVFLVMLALHYLMVSLTQLLL